MTDAPARCSTCGVELVGGVRVAEGVRAGPWLALCEELVVVARARDWGRMRELHSPDFREHSHQAGLRYDISGRNEQVESLVNMYDRDADYLYEILDARGSWCLARFHSWGSGDDVAASWEVGRLLVAKADASWRVEELQIYDEAETTGARARFEELAGNTRAVRGPKS